MTKATACRNLLALLALAWVAGCASLHEPQSGNAPAQPLPDHYAVSGRISAHYGEHAFSGGFSWQHNPTNDAIELTTPLGQTVARLSGTPTEVTYVGSDGRVENASSWTALTERALGWALPVEGLSSWIQGAPRPDATFEAERDDAGRIDVLRQSGWQVVYQKRASAATDALERPVIVRLAYPEIDLRIAVDLWR